jgi:hypothetical protein
MSEWHPMDSAPRDGTEVMVKRTRRSKHPKFRSEVIAHWNPQTFYGPAWLSRQAQGVYMRDDHLEGWAPLRP